MPFRCFSRSGLRYVTRTSSPRSARSLVTWPPRKPVAPVTTAFMNVHVPRSAQKQPEDRLGPARVGPLAEDEIEIRVGLDHPDDHVRDLPAVGVELDALAFQEVLDPADEPRLEAPV